MECKEAIFIMTSNESNKEIAAHACRLKREAKLYHEAANRIVRRELIFQRNCSR